MEEEYDVQVDGMRYVPLVRHYDLFSLPRNGTGLLSGSFPLSLVTQGGNLPSQAEIRILYRPEAGHPGDGVVVATTTCNADGTWQVSGLDENLKFDIVARIPGFNDVIISNVQPAGAPLSAHFVGIKEEFEYEEEVNIQVVALGGTPPYIYTVNTLPEGLTFNSDTGYITGSMPAGDLTISITVVDAASDSVTVVWGGTVVNPLPSDIGEAFGGGFYAGDIEDGGHWYKLIVADVEADVYGLPWGGYGTNLQAASSTTNGPANTQAMAGDSRFPAGNHCLDYRGGGFDDWYMPARSELQVIYENLGHNRTPPAGFESGGAQAFHPSHFYLCSTQHSANNAWGRRFSDGYENYDSKGSATRRVRPVRRIPFTP